MCCLTSVCLTFTRCIGKTKKTCFILSTNFCWEEISLSVVNISSFYQLIPLYLSRWIMFCKTVYLSLSWSQCVLHTHIYLPKTVNNFNKTFKKEEYLHVLLVFSSFSYGCLLTKKKLKLSSFPILTYPGMYFSFLFLWLIIILTREFFNKMDPTHPQKQNQTLFFSLIYLHLISAATFKFSSLTILITKQNKIWISKLVGSFDLGPTDPAGIGGEITWKSGCRLTDSNGGAETPQIPPSHNADDPCSTGSRPRNDQPVFRRYAHTTSPLLHHG